MHRVVSAKTFKIDRGELSIESATQPDGSFAITWEGGLPMLVDDPIDLRVCGDPGQEFEFHCECFLAWHEPVRGRLEMTDFRTARVRFAKTKFAHSSQYKRVLMPKQTPVIRV
jgi:hypothetical protein